MSDFSGWVTQAPLWIVCIVGLWRGWQHQATHPAASRRVLLAFGLFLVHLLAERQMSLFLVTQANQQGQDLETLSQQLFWVSLVGNLLPAWASWLLLSAIFPTLSGPQPTWQRRLIGAIIGLLLGGFIAILGGDALAQALGISNFEGGRGYFVAFLVVPAAALLGAVIGALVSARR
jgi:hypothetical protein